MGPHNVAATHNITNVPNITSNYSGSPHYHIAMPCLIHTSKRTDALSVLITLADHAILGLCEDSMVWKASNTCANEPTGKDIYARHV